MNARSWLLSLILCVVPGLAARAGDEACAAAACRLCVDAEGRARACGTDERGKQWDSSRVELGEVPPNSERGAASQAPFRITVDGAPPTGEASAGGAEQQRRDGAEQQRRDDTALAGAEV